MTAGVYLQYGEMRRVALEMALEHCRNSPATGDEIINLAETFFLFLISGG